MKKVLLVLAVLGAAALFSSCSKCYDCTLEVLGVSTTVNDVCEDGAVEISYYEDLGYECTEQ